MRLLSIDDSNPHNGGLRLTSFENDEDVPPYAILSHTWTHGDEVSFDDLEAGVATTRPAFHKVLWCGRQARIDGLVYFWVDTCCIRRSDAAELSTAINSMFRWYKNAETCYVYLQDIGLPGGADVYEVMKHRWWWDQVFGRSRWFFRGWTLQELLAPRRVMFFSYGHQYLGDKTSLMDELSRITGIPRAALSDSDNIGCFSFEQIWGWMEHRDTTYKEDKVYSLLGMFGAYLPLIYGEGVDHALKRLKREISNQD